MMMLSTGHVSLVGMALASLGFGDATRETLSVTGGGITFTVVAYDDGRNKPYRLKFSQDGSRSLYTFDSDTIVTNLKVGTEKYKVSYDDSDNLESVRLTSSTRRALAHQQNDAVVAMEGRRLDFAVCTVCEEAWDALCSGVSSVCDLADYGSPLSTAAAASVDTVCDTFGSVCSSYEASEACQDQCTDDEETGSSDNSCLDPTSADYKCTFSGDTTMEFTDCDLRDDDVPFLPACFEEFGKTNVVQLDLDESTISSFAEDTFAGLSELTSLDLYSNKLVTVPEGLFSGLTKLEFLDMAFNDLTSLPEGAFSDLESLQILRIFDNELTPEGLPIGLFSGLSQLQELYLDGNDLRDMTSLVGLFDGLTGLIELGLGECGMRTLPDGLFADLTKLEELSFYINGLSDLPEGVFSGLTSLLRLELTDNNLSTLGSTLSGLTELRTLQLEYNDLLLTEDAFSGLVNLEKLDLEGCRLTTLPAGVFSPMANLQTLDLFDNEDLQCLPSTTATDVFLDSEDIRDGTCECTPEEAVFCEDGFSCLSGTAGYTCVAE